MKILRKAYNSLLNDTPPLPPETGGILGGNDGIISEIFFDQNEDIHNAPAIYVPNIGLINKTIESWERTGISFYGMFHSHYSRDRELSPGDRKYILEIMRAMPRTISRLYFPIILPGEAVFGYHADRWNSEVHIARNNIEIL